MYNYKSTIITKYLSIQTTGKIFTSAVFILLFLTAATLNIRAQAADSFNPNANGTVEIIVRQPDGKVLIGGSFSMVGGQPRTYIARVNADGSLDTTFTSPLNGGGNGIYAIALQSDGKILIGGGFSNGGGPAINLYRLNSDGTIDSTFNNPLPNNPVGSITIMSDGKILIGGTFRLFGTSPNNFSQNFLARLNTDGSVDRTFDPFLNYNGSASGSGIRRIIVQSDGKILVGGTFNFNNSSGFYRGTLARFNPDGTVDSFDTGIALGSSYLYDVKLQPDGKILVASDFINTTGEVLRRRIARLNTDGTLDTSFDAMFPQITNNVDVKAIALQPDGKILVGGQFLQIGGQPRDVIARLNPNGSADSFSVNTFGSASSIIVQPDGKILVGGNFNTMGGQPRNNIARLYSSELGEGTQPILFISNRDGNNEIYRMNVDGSNQQRLTNTTENETFALWSPDGTKILFIRQISTNVRQIWTMNADGSNQVRISPETVYSTIYKYSPNGQKILFTRSPSASTVNIWVMNTDGSNPVQLTNNGTSPIEDHFPEWSPDGSKIAFGRCATPSYICDVYTMNANGSNQTNLTTDNPNNDDDNPKWTRDGNRIVYGRLSSDRGEPYVMNANGSNKQALATFGANQYSFPQAISPDGTKVTLDFSDGATLTSREIYMIGVGGGIPVNVTNNAVFDGFSAWSPDSAKIAFRSRRDTAADEIYTMNADGSNVVRLTFNTTTDFVTDWFKPTVIKRAPFDFDGDGKTDIGIFRPAPGEWWINRSSSGQTFALQFGSSTDQIAAGDYTGDGKADVAFYRPSSGTWFILRSEDSSFYAFPFGATGDLPVPADYDGDGKTDAAVFRESTLTWYIQKSSGGVDFIGFGAAGDKPVIADYDGDGKADIAITRINGTNREWWIRRSSDGQIQALSFGEGNDKAVVGDYTGDGKTDIAFWRPSNGFWYILRSEDNSFYAFPFGTNGDVPTPGDYDGDGKFDAAIFRPSDTVWYQQRSTQGFTAITFGTNGDIPIPNSVVR